MRRSKSLIINVSLVESSPTAQFPDCVLLESSTAGSLDDSQWDTDIF